MYRGFNLKLNWYEEDYYKKGASLYTTHKNYIRDTLKTFAYTDGSLDGSAMQSNWFPQINADVFISHSHKDEKKAIALSGWLFSTFNIKCFIDSCIWGYSDDLLKLIDNKYCLKEDGNYNYSKRNYSTSHIHMMLSTALTMMIDKTECLFFLNSPNSLTTSEVVNKTESPWIYSEIAITQLIRQNIPPRRFRNETKYFSKGGELNERMKISYEVSLSHLASLNIDDLIEWEKIYNSETTSEALILYTK